VAEHWKKVMITHYKQSFYGILYLPSLLLFVFATQVFAQNFGNEVSSFVSIKNPLQFEIKGVVVPVFVDEIQKKYSEFNPISTVTLINGQPVFHEYVTNYQNNRDAILLYLNLKPNELIEVFFNEPEKESEIPILPKMTQAHLGKRTGYTRTDSFYIGGKFESVSNTKVPSDHWSHDGLYKYEGPGWESDKVGYRFYLDNRNRTDIFGKKTPHMVLDTVGINDLVANGKESYTNMQNWGMDIFKVGTSLGIGSIAHFNNGKIITISETDSVVCRIKNNGTLFSRVETKYYGWKVSDKKVDLLSEFSINAGSRLTKVDIHVDSEIGNITTGLAKHPEAKTKLVGNDKNDWNYLALWGKQALPGDSLGIAVFYKTADFIDMGNDEGSEFILLKPDQNKLTYYFAAAWEKEPGGVKNLYDFMEYLEQTVILLCNPPLVEY
jgi:hypothetical protein